MSEIVEEYLNLLFPLWKDFKINDSVRLDLIKWTIDDINSNKRRFLILKLLKTGVYDTFESMYWSNAIRWGFIRSEDSEFITIGVKRNILDPLECIRKCLYDSYFISFKCFLNFVTVKQINKRKYYYKLIETAIILGKPEYLDLLISKGADVFDLDLSRIYNGFAKKNNEHEKCLKMINKKQNEILFNLLYPYLIDDICNLILFFYLN